MRLFSRPGVPAGAPVPEFEYHLGPQYPLDQALAARMSRVPQLLPFRVEPYGTGMTLRFYGAGESLQQRLLRPMGGRDACALLDHMAALLRALVREQLPIKNLSFQARCALFDAQQGTWRFTYLPVSGLAVNLDATERFFKGIGEALIPADEDATGVKTSYLAFFRQRERFDIMAFPTHLEQVVASVSCRPFKTDGRQRAQEAARVVPKESSKPAPVPGGTVNLGARSYASQMQASDMQAAPAQRVSPAAGLSRALHGEKTEVIAPAATQGLGAAVVSSPPAVGAGGISAAAAPVNKAQATGAPARRPAISRTPTVVVAGIDVHHIPGVTDAPRGMDAAPKAADDPCVQGAGEQTSPVSQTPITTQVPKPKREGDISVGNRGEIPETEVIAGEDQRIDASSGAQTLLTVSLEQAPVFARTPATDEPEPAPAADRTDSDPEGEPVRKRAPRRRYFLTRLSTKERFEVRGRRFVVGKSKYSSYQVRNTTTVSRSHALFFCSDEGCSVEDDGSRNGTYLNGERIYQGKRYALEDDDRIRMSDETFVFEVLEASEEGSEE